MLDIILKGGPIMIIILGLFFVGTVIIIERLIFFKKIKLDEDKMINRLKEALRQNHYQEALSICETNPTPITNLMKVGIEHRHLEAGTIRDMIVSAANMEVPRLERFLSTLGTIAHIAPLLGLLGTVTGNIDAFGVLGKFGSVGDPALLASGISEALITTAAGLIVSIPTITFYNYLVNKVNHIIIRLENRVNEMVLLLRGTKRVGGGDAV